MEQQPVGKPGVAMDRTPPEGSSNQREFALVVFDSEFGNTEKIARALARGLHETGMVVDCVSIKDAPIGRLDQYILLAVGGPTQALRASPRMKDFLAKLEGMDLSRESGFAFDTKLNNPLSGNAGGYIEKKLKKLGVQILLPHASAIVGGKPVSLREGEEERFEKIGLDLGSHWRDR